MSPGRAPPLPRPPRAYREILALAGPLFLSTSGLMLMQFLDGLFLSWYSPEALAAAGPAGMAAAVPVFLFGGVAGYTATFVSQFIGAGREERAGAAVWQGLYLSAAAGALVAACALAAGPLFAWMGHAPAVRAQEEDFFRYLCAGAVFSLAANALSGFFSGAGKTRLLMAIQLSGFAVNAPLAYGLIFGHWGCPRLGIRGAALATVAGQAWTALALLAAFWARPHRNRYGTWSGRAPDRALLARSLRFGFPAGLRVGAEVLGWTVFLIFVGRSGTEALAASTIAWRINGLAFFPIFGLSTAVGVLVGRAMGARRPDLAAAATYRGLALAEVWMVSLAATFLLFPRQLYGWFRPEGAGAEFAAIAAQGAVLLRFVAAYCLMDSANLVVVGALQAAGDTRWTFAATLAAYCLFAAALALADRLGLGLYGEWALATLFVLAIASLWIARFHQGRWRNMDVLGDGGRG